MQYWLQINRKKKVKDSIVKRKLAAKYLLFSPESPLNIKRRAITTTPPRTVGNIDNFWLITKSRFFVKNWRQIFHIFLNWKLIKLFFFAIFYETKKVNISHCAPRYWYAWAIGSFTNENKVGWKSYSQGRFLLTTGHFPYFKRATKWCQ